MTSIPFPPTAYPGERAEEGQGNLVNVLVEKNADQISHKRASGLTAVTDTGKSTPRGFLDVNGTLYGAFKDVAVTISPSGTVTTLTGALTGSNPATWAQNNKAPTRDVVCVADNVAYVVTSTAVSAYPDGDLPGSPNDVCSLDGYFLFTYSDGSIWASDLNTTAVNALSFAKAEARPDSLLRGISSGQRFYAMGPASIEVWSDRGTSPFPLGRDAVIPVGLRGQWAVAGYEDGWEGQLIFVASDGTVRALDGYNPQSIAPNWVQRLIASSSAANLRARVYISSGQGIWSLSGDNFTVEYNVGTGSWTQRKSYLQSTWRGGPTLWWNSQWIVGDTLTTKLLRIDDSRDFEDQNPLQWQIESGPMFGVQANAAIFRFAMGMGSATLVDPVQIEPQIEISWSDDGGNTWSEPLFRSLGKQGRFNGRIELHRAAWQRGYTSRQGRKWRISCSDPVPLVFLGGEVGMR